MFAPFQARASEKWNDQPGGTVVERYTDPQTEVEYVLVEFDKSPGRYYVYYG
jgi:hypothetical protein